MTDLPKLVRDRIPTIIEERGAVPIVSTVEREERVTWLMKKLQEEVAELAETPCVEELADTLEVLRAVAEALGTPFARVEEVRRKKVAERGGFEQGLILLAIDSR